VSRRPGRDDALAALAVLAVRWFLRRRRRRATVAAVEQAAPRSVLAEMERDYAVSLAELGRSDATAGLHLLFLVAIAAVVGQVGDKLTPLVLTLACCMIVPASVIAFCATRILAVRGTRGGAARVASWPWVAKSEQRRGALVAAYRATSAEELIEGQLYAIANINAARAVWKRKMQPWVVVLLAIAAVTVVAGVVEAHWPWR
jgi:hypothetical protein